MPISFMKNLGIPHYPEVNTYADLPAANAVTGMTYVVLQKTGTWALLTLKRAGLYYSDGATWTRLGNAQNFFYDDEFMLRNTDDPTKQLQVDVSSISTGTTRTVDFPDSSGTVAIEGRDVYFNTVNGRDVDADGVVLDGLVTIQQESFEPTGFVNKTDTTLSFTDVSRQLSIAPAVTSYAYYIKGVRYDKTGTDSFTISDVEGMHFIYFDGTTLTEVTGSFNISILKDYCYVAAIYWDATNKKGVYVADERHGMVMDWATHGHFHLSFGAQFITGLDMWLTADGDGSLAAHAQGLVNDGQIRDEDILHIISNGSPQTLSPIAQIPILYRTGINEEWRYLPSTGYLVTTTGTGRAAYNQFTGTTWQLTEVANNGFVLMHIYATNDINNPIFAVVGVNQYTKAKDAQAGANEEINLVGDLPFEELVPIATIIFETSDTFTNTVKSTVVSTDAGTAYIDWRSVSISATTIFGDHNLLANRTDPESHPFSAIAIDSQIGSPVTIDSLEEVYDGLYSSGIASGCALTDNGDGTIDLASGCAFLRATGGTSTSTIYSVEVNAQAGLSLTDDAINYVYLDYNSGTPLFFSTTNAATVDMISKIPAYVIVRDGISLSILDVREQNIDHIGKNQLKEFYVSPFQRKNGGAIISDAGTLHLACTAGAFYFQLNEYSVPAIDTSVTGTFKYYYQNGTGGWTYVNSAVFDPDNYDAGTGSLVGVAPLKYTNHWIYASVSNSSEYIVLYPQQTHTIFANAFSEGVPSNVPTIIEGLGVLLGRAIVQQSDTEVVEVQSTFFETFNSSAAQQHNNLAGLDGGVTGEYFHLTSAEHTAVQEYIDLAPFYIGAVLDDVSLSVSSNGTTITFTIEKSGTGDVRYYSSTGIKTLDCTPATTAVLTPGSDTSPQANYVYIDSATNLIVVSTTGFPTTEHAPLVTYLLGSATLVQTSGSYKTHYWTDHVQATSDNGHLSHLNKWIRTQHATWIEGSALSYTGSGTATVNMSIASGTMFQLHEHTTPAISSPAPFYVVNDETTPYTNSTNLASIVTDTNGATLNNRYYALVVWYSYSNTTGDSKLYINKPSGSYLSQADARADVDKYTDYSIPPDFTGTAFLVKRFICRLSVGNVTIYDGAGDDLRGTFPNTIAGSSTGVATTFSDNTFNVTNVTDNTKVLKVDVSGVTTATTRTLGIPDKDGTVAISNTAETFTSLTTAIPTGGSSGTWKLGTYNTDGVGLNLDTANYITVDIGGTLHKLAVLT